MGVLDCIKILSFKEMRDICSTNNVFLGEHSTRREFYKVRILDGVFIRNYYRPYSTTERRELPTHMHECKPGRMDR